MTDEARGRAIAEGRCVLGLEFGSTVIKAVLIDETRDVVAVGTHRWENSLIDGLWTYRLSEIEEGLQGCYRSLKTDVEHRYGVTLSSVAALGVSAMMHGFMAFDGKGRLLGSFRTWRNTNTGPAARALSKLFDFNIPERWSIAHLYQAILDDEPFVADIARLTTLAGYVHGRLTGQNVVGIGDASGMFPIDEATGGFNGSMINDFDGLIAGRGLPWTLGDLLPQVLVAGADAGRLTVEGAAWLDPDGDLKAGIPLCPCEGDAGTGMVATNSVRPRTGNVSAGTSIFGMVTLEAPLSARHREIDVVTTPDGHPVAMVHCNNCTSDINAWEGLFEEVVGAFTPVSADELFPKLFTAALEGTPDCAGMLSFNYYGGEPITGLEAGRPLFVRDPDTPLSLATFMRTQLCSALATFRIGYDILRRDESVRVDEICAHGGFFKTPLVGQRLLAAAMDAPISVRETVGEGGAWGMALLAAYRADGAPAPLPEWLGGVFASMPVSTMDPAADEVAAFDGFLERYRAALPVERAAVACVDPMAAESDSSDDDAAVAALKARVCAANKRLPAAGLVTLTWGNVSEIDRVRGLVAIKPSGVDYDALTPDAIVVVDLDGHVVEGTLRPSSDTATHLELYRAFPTVGGIVHTHSTYATSWAQAGRPISCYGTTHADAFHGPIPCLPPLDAAAIQDDYERNIGRQIVDEFATRAIDPTAMGAVLCQHHGPFTWGADADDAVHNAIVLEEVAKMALFTEQINPNGPTAPTALQEKHYERKHGPDAYYGQA